MNKYKFKKDKNSVGTAPCIEALEGSYRAVEETSHTITLAGIPGGWWSTRHKDNCWVVDKAYLNLYKEKKLIIISK